MVDYSSIIRLVLKLFGIVLVVYSALAVASSLPYLFSDPDNWMSAPALVSTAVPFLFGIFLWLFPAPVTNTIVRSSASKAKDNDFALQLERIGVSLLGLFLFYRVISSLVYQISIIALARDAAGVLPNEHKAGIAVSVLQLGIALLMLLRSRGIVNLLRRYREVGVPKAS